MPFNSRAFNIIAIIVVLYIALGAVIAPKMMSYYLTHQLADKLKHTVNVGNISLNPFTLHLQINDLELKDNQHTLLAFKTFHLNYNAASLLSASYGIDEISLDKPVVDIAINKEGEIHLLTVFERLSTNKTSDVESESADLPALLVKKLRITNAQINLQSEQLAQPFQKTLLLPSIAIDDFHTTHADNNNRFSVIIKDEKQGSLELNAVIQLANQAITGDINIQQLNIKPIIDAFGIPFDVAINDLPVDLNTQFSINYKNDIDIKVNNGELILHNINIKPLDKDDAVIDVPFIKLHNIDVDVLKKSIKVGEINARKGFIQLVLDKAGQLNLQQLFTLNNTDNEENPEDASSEKAWQVLVKQININNHRIHFLNEQTTTPLVLESYAEIKASNWQPLDLAVAFPVNAKVTLADEAQIQVDSTLTLFPFAINAEASIAQLQLALAQSFIDELISVDVKSGNLHSKTTIHIETKDELIVQVDGSATIDNLHIQPKNRTKKLLTWKQLNINKIHYALPINTLVIDVVDIQQPYSRLIINEKGVNNLQNLIIKNVESSQKAVAEPLTINPFQWDIAKVRITDGDMGFSDLSLKPSVRTSIKALSGEINKITSDSQKISTIKMRGKVDRYAPVIIDGTFNTSPEHPAFDVSLDFKNIELSTFAPYSSTYAGYGIEKGQLSFELRYLYVDKKIKGTNHLVLNQLTLGDKVKSDKAIDIPLKLAVALLTDEKGIIDLNFEVKGAVDDPQFSLRSIVFKTLTDILKKAVAAPFKLLGSLNSSKQKNIQKITFIAGSDEITQDSSEKLDVVADFLHKRELLLLNIQGNASLLKDKPALQEKELLQILAVETTQNEQMFLPENNPVANEELYNIVDEYYTKQHDQSLNALEKTLKKQPENSTLSDEQIAQLTYATAWVRLVDDMVVTNDDVVNLAQKRAHHIKAILVERHKVSAERVYILKSNSSSIAPSLNTHLMVDAR